MNNLRTIYVKELIKELYGPRNGVNEILSENPTKTYLTGVIIPSSQKITNNQNPDNEETRDIFVANNINGKDFAGFGDDSDFEEDITYSVPNELNPNNQLKSFGISFTISGNPIVMRVCLSWARYSKISTDNKKISWKREPFYKIMEITINKDKNQKIPVYGLENNDVYLNIRKIRSDNINNKYDIIVSLINDLKSLGDKSEDNSLNSLYQPSIRINILNGKLEPTKIQIKEPIDYVNRHLSPYARGHMCAAVWKDIDYIKYIGVDAIWPDAKIFGSDVDEFISCDLRSEFIPLYAQATPDLSVDSDAELSAYKLSEAWDKEEIKKYLYPLITAYSNWINDNKNKCLDDNSDYRQIENLILKNELLCQDRIESGIQCILDNEDARMAFCFANRVLWLQNNWKQQQKSNGNSNDFRWRPFQIAFFLTTVESIYNRDSPYRDTLDLLWVSTGGGKTEAYLGIMAFTIALRRIRFSKNKDNYSEGGLSILSRYTLRLLTVQQFRRTLLMCTAAEYLRIIKCGNYHGWRPSKCNCNVDWLYGKIRISTGLLVGSGISPNNLRDKGNGNEVSGAISSLKGSNTDSDPAQITKCPVCGAWLSIPKSGLPQGENQILHQTVYLKTDIDEANERLSNYIDEHEGFTISNCSIIRDSFLHGEKTHIYTLNVHINAKKEVPENEIDDAIRKIVNESIGLLDGYFISFRPSKPGYFPLPDEPISKRSRLKVSTSPDFDIYCPNPKCDLNVCKTWEETLPLEKETNNPFVKDGCVPIPAYTVDEQIYHRCPTILISTADKIARFAFEPRSGTLFGDANIYNKYYGYLRGEEESYQPKNVSSAAISGDNNISCKPFLPLDLIVQDELHLLEGPLGSMFGLYELMIRALIKKANGKPKYISSSATVNHAEKQIEALFGVKSQQFPPYGLKSEDSFFVKYRKESAWDNDKAGRMYMGILCPGNGVLTPNIRIWSRLLKTGMDNENDDYINNYWTIVGYNNSIRELGGISALYRSDIEERLTQISGNNKRKIDPDNNLKSIELSSRIPSTTVPQTLEMLEKGELRNHRDNQDAIFTTSMFGTGVDVPHLSLMIINGQPKTTSQYIQASGRVGRTHGALVPVLYKPGKPRDLSHYEMFTGYHQMINHYVEETPVSPFSTGCMERALAGVMISYFRNACNTENNWNSTGEGHTISNEKADDDFRDFILMCKNSMHIWSQDLENNLQSIFDIWKNRSKNHNNCELKYTENVWHKSEATKCVVLGDSSHPIYDGKTEHWSVFKNVPQSLRDVEESTDLEV